MGFHFDAAKQIAFEDVYEENEQERAEQQATADFEKGYKIPERKNRQMVEMSEGVEYMQSAASSPRRARRFSRVASYEQEVIDSEEDENEDGDEEMEDEDMEGHEGDYEDQEGGYEEPSYDDEEPISAEEETEEDD